jgi:hypothetical protein
MFFMSSRLHGQVLFREASSPGKDGYGYEILMSLMYNHFRFICTFMNMGGVYLESLKVGR